MLELAVSLPGPLALGIGGSIGIIGAAIALGFRHGIDWDHIAAITDITSTTTSKEEGSGEWLTNEPGVLLTDESHHAADHGPEHGHVHGEPDAHAAPAVATAHNQTPAAAPVVRLAYAGGLSQGMRPVVATPAFSLPVPRLLAEQRRAIFLGTLYALGHGSIVVVLGLLAILASSVLPGWVDPIMERVVGVTLILLGLYLSYAVFRYFRGGGSFRLRSRWMLVFAGVRNGFSWLSARLRHEHQHQHVHGSDQYGPRTAFAVGLIHGIGAETGTQVLVIATVVGAATKTLGIVALGGFVVGLLLSNSLVTVTTAAGFLSAQRRQGIYVAVGVVAACFSLVVGSIFLLHAASILPDLGHYFRWIGPSN